MMGPAAAVHDHPGVESGLCAWLGRAKVWVKGSDDQGPWVGGLSCALSGWAAAGSSASQGQGLVTGGWVSVHVCTGQGRRGRGGGVTVGSPEGSDKVWGSS
ncbi:hypothetical protein DM860_006148 [Cuscuta australis]|uniref:Uncharacterized protein n=1 Tax=Cuscuta australis TaxID=267555 RepID=A0A328DKA2_9ASTE|nr:hypothetical protein DM860_006148 [Cuscuta australis]